MIEKVIKLFSDSTGRLIIGNIVEENDERILVNMPMLVVVQPAVQENPQQPQGSPQQILFMPYAYLELLENFGMDHVWTFDKRTAVVSDKPVAQQAVQMYEGNVENVKQKVELASNVGQQEVIPAGQVNEAGKVVTLFEGDDK